MELAVVKVHQFDEWRTRLWLPGKCEKIVDLLIIDAMKNHHVEFYRSEPYPECCIDTGENLVLPVVSRYSPVSFGIQAVKADIDPAQPGTF